jgi:nicotinate-nucleotide adenylyltransferase
VKRRSAPVRFSGSIRRGRQAGPLKRETLWPGMKVGLFGGSFDPVHAGHLHVAQSALKYLGLDRIWWIVSPQNPLKMREAGAYEDRLQKVEQVATNPRMVVSDIENRTGIKTTADLIQSLKTRHPGVRFVWIMGADNLQQFHRWYRWQDIAGTVPIAVIARPQNPIGARLSPAARAMSAHRITETHAKVLAERGAPGWTYLTEPLHTEASSRLRDT